MIIIQWKYGNDVTKKKKVRQETLPHRKIVYSL